MNVAQTYCFTIFTQILLKFCDIVSLRCNIGINVKKGEWYHYKYCMHANHKLFSFHSHGNVVIKFANGVHHKIISFMGSFQICAKFVIL
jgi:hypothetical protein